MWAHYASKHKGFCIEYDLLKASENLLVNLHPVIYSKERARVPKSLFDISDIKSIKVSTNNESLVDLIVAFLRKSDIWKYENEWRLLLFGDNEATSG